MREILFRGKGVVVNDWYYGDLMQYENGNTAIMYDKISDFGYECTEMYKRSQVDPRTVGQFTGLCDKNGKKIFEGDIIKSSYDGVLKVFFDDDDMGFYPFSQPAFGGYEWANCMVGESSEYIEIIGNIYDNPELVK